ncbi:glycoside hydrolase family protein [Kingella potus]|uniref:glycoside hydrolase family protein n=1 Tax=Kingella potus TaxID=265175 RepID=UPI003D22701E
MNNKSKYAIGGLAVSAAFFTALMRHEGYRAAPYRDSGGVPTIGIGSTQYPDGRRVQMADPPVTPAQAVEISRVHVAKDEGRLKALLPGVKLSQADRAAQYRRGQADKAAEISLALAEAAKQQAAAARQASADYQAAKAEREQKERIRYVQVQKTIERPVYHTDCIDTDGLRQLNAAIAE